MAALTIGANANAGNYCVSYDEYMPGFGLHYQHVAKCSWTDKSVSSDLTFAFAGFVTQETKEEHRGVVESKLNAFGLRKIAQVDAFSNPNDGFTIYSDEPLIEGQSVCIDYAKIICSDRPKLMMTVVPGEAEASRESILKANGYKVVSNIKLVRNMPIYKK